MCLSPWSCLYGVSMGGQLYPSKHSRKCSYERCNKIMLRKISPGGYEYISLPGLACIVFSGYSVYMYGVSLGGQLYPSKHTGKCSYERCNNIMPRKISVVSLGGDEYISLSLVLPVWCQFGRTAVSREELRHAPSRLLAAWIR